MLWRWRRRYRLARHRCNVVVQIFHMHRDIVDNHEVLAGEFRLALYFSCLVEGDGASGKFCLCSLALFCLGFLQTLLYRLHILLVIAKIATIARREPPVETILKHIQDREDDLSVERIAGFFLVAEGAISKPKQE